LGLTEPPHDQIASVTRGAVHGALDWTKDQVAGLVNRIRNREVAFVQNRETIELIREDRRGEEWLIFKDLIGDRTLRIIFQMGLTLRRLERDRDQVQNLRDLRSRIVRKYGVAGLRAAELVQRGILGTYFLKLLRESASTADIESAVEDLMRRVDLYTAFIQEKDDIKEIVKELHIRVLSQSARIFIVLGYGAAKVKARKAVEDLLKSLPKTYGAEKHETDRDFFAFVGKTHEGELQLVLPF
jgi:hypothetical protein